MCVCDSERERERERVVVKQRIFVCGHDCVFEGQHKAAHKSCLAYSVQLHSIPFNGI